MTSFEHRPTNSPSSDELIRELLEGHETESTYYQNMMYAAALEELRTQQRPFDEIRKLLIEHHVPGAEVIEPAEACQPLLDDLWEGRSVDFQRSDGNYYLGIIDGEPKLYIDIDIPRSKTLAIIELPIEYEGEIDYPLFYPRRSEKSGELFIPGLKLL